MGGKSTAFDGRRAVFLMRADGSVYGRVARAWKVLAIDDDFAVWLLLNEGVMATDFLPDEPDFGNGVRLLSHHVVFDGDGILFHHLATVEKRISRIKAKGTEKIRSFFCRRLCHIICDIAKKF